MTVLHRDECKISMAVISVSSADVPVHKSADVPVHNCRRARTQLQTCLYITADVPVYKCNICVDGFLILITFFSFRFDRSQLITGKQSNKTNSHKVGPTHKHSHTRTQNYHSEHEEKQCKMSTYS